MLTFFIMATNHAPQKRQGTQVLIRSEAALPISRKSGPRSTAGWTRWRCPRTKSSARLAEHGRASLGEFLTASGRGVRLDVAKAAKSGKLHLLKSYAKGKDGVKIEMVDAQAALVQLGRHHKLFTDKTEITGAGGAPLFGELTDEALDRLIAEAEAKKEAIPKEAVVSPRVEDDQPSVGQ